MPFKLEEVERLRRIVREEFGEDIGLDEAQEMGARLVRLLKILTRRLPGGETGEKKGGKAG